MEDLRRHEEMEMLVLERLRKDRLLDPLVFGGGTMLRLCFDLPRYSVDFDFYLKGGGKAGSDWASRMGKSLRGLGAELTDEWEKHFTYLWELRLPPYPRRLKIEVRKTGPENVETELAIAHSPSSPHQVRLRVLTLRQMWKNKVRALLDRHEIRDAYDLEFLTLRNTGAFGELDTETRKKLIGRLDDFGNKDFKSVLAAVLEKDERERVLGSRFSYLRSKLV